MVQHIATRERLLSGAHFRGPTDRKWAACRLMMKYFFSTRSRVCGMLRPRVATAHRIT